MASLVSNIISYWPGNEASGNLIDLLVASGNDLTDTNTVTNSAGKVYSTARQYTAANSEYHTRADNASLSVGGTNFSICAWVFLDSDALFNIISKDDNGVNREYSLNYSTALNRFQFVTWTAASGVGIKTITASNFGAVSLSTWYFLAAVYNGAGNFFYVNTVLNSAASTDTGWDGAADFTIGRSGAGNYFNGRIGPAAFWKRAITATEIDRLYNGGNGISFAAMLSGRTLPLREGIGMHRRLAKF